MNTRLYSLGEERMIDLDELEKLYAAGEKGFPEPASIAFQTIPHLIAEIREGRKENGVMASIQDKRDAARYRELNAFEAIVMYVLGSGHAKSHLNLKCGEPLDKWLDERIAANRRQNER